MKAVTCRIKEFIQPFERCLALQELRALTDGPVVPIDGDENSARTFSAKAPRNTEALRGALAYWCSVGGEPEGLTAQLKGEATFLIARNGTSTEDLPESVPAQIPIALPNSRYLRYATHGIHEYRGKFFPQLVRALLNIAKLPNDAMVMDPMCGSGTTLVEARLSGRSCYGLDMNPLSVFLSRIKCDALTLGASDLVTSFLTLKETLERSSDCNQGASTRFSDTDLSYLARWFHPQTLKELDRVKSAVERLTTPVLRDFYLVSLSNVLRKVSWQKNDDLRVRREENTLAVGETVERFLVEALRSTRIVAAFLAERGSIAPESHHVLQADARRGSEILPHLIGQVSTIITSPPYATALPYIDTDRLSLIYLGLLPRAKHRALDTEMIGNREVTSKGRDNCWSAYQENKELLPQKTRSLIERIDELNRNGIVGFRRRNLSALLSKYFLDMRTALQQMHVLLRPRGRVFLVVGNNRTTAGGIPIEIETSAHLRSIAEELGFSIFESVPMEMLVSRDIFRRNATPSEKILVFEKP